MCLTTVTHAPHPQEQGEGWKVFEQRDSTLVSPFLLFHAPDFFRQTFPTTNTWTTDERNFCLNSEEKTPYPTGFHLFVNKEDAEVFSNKAYAPQNPYVVRKVKYRNVAAKGRQIISETHWEGCTPQMVNQRSATVIVAKEICILDEEPQG
jgi:hypothetical protein